MRKIVKTSLQKHFKCILHLRHSLKIQVQQFLWVQILYSLHHSQRLLEELTKKERKKTEKNQCWGKITNGRKLQFFFWHIFVFFLGMNGNTNSQIQTNKFTRKGHTQNFHYVDILYPFMSLLKCFGSNQLKQYTFSLWELRFKQWRSQIKEK